MKVGGRMAHLVATIISPGMIGIGRLKLLIQNIKIDGHTRQQDLGFTLCHIITQFLVLTGIFKFVLIC